MGNTINENDIMIDGMSEIAFPYLDELCQEYQMHPKAFAKFGIQLLDEDYSIGKHSATILVEAWLEKKRVKCQK